jgi:hypothetical protein
VVYAWVIKRYFKKETPLTTWLGNTVSIIVAAFVAIFLFALQNHITDRQIKQKHLDLIAAEIRTNLRDLNNPRRMVFPRGELTIKALVIDLQDIAMVKAIESGLFNASETDALYIMVNGIAKFRRDRESLLSQMNGPPQNLQQAADAIEKQRQALIDATDEFAQHLGIQKKMSNPAFQ